MLVGTIILYTKIMAEQPCLNSYFNTTQLVMGTIENFLSRLFKDKTPWYPSILPYSDIYILINILLKNLPFMASCTYFSEQ